MQRKTATASLRAIASVALGGLAVGLLASGSCVVHAHHCTDADGDGRCDPHPPHGTSTASSTEEPWPELASADPRLFRIERYTLVVGAEAEVRETRRLEDVRGVSMLHTAPPRAWDARSVRLFGDRVLDVNQGLLALHGPRRFEGVSAIGSGFRLDYAVGREGRVHLVLDRLGNLVAVASRPDAERHGAAP